MITIKNLRKEKRGDWAYLVVDIDVRKAKNPFKEKTMWFAVESQNADMLTDEVYDAFAPFVLYLGMYYHQNVHIEGKISPRLYHNIMHYLMVIFNNFSKYNKLIEFKVDDFKKIQGGPGNLIGTGMSCGVDSLTTIYDNYIETKDPDFKINSLFVMNCGDNGSFEDEKTREIWLKRAELDKKAADELGLPLYLIDSNLHSFSFPLKTGHNGLVYISKYCAAMALQKYIKRYLTASCTSYDSCSEYSLSERDIDIAYYCETYMPHLISTERFETVIDGCQYERADKIKKICDWNIARKYLNVCLNPKDDMGNCSKCQKCARTLLVLETLGKLDNYRDIFDLDTYRRNREFWLSHHLQGNTEQCKSLTKFLREQKKISFMDIILSRPKFFYYRIVRKINKITKRQNAR